jgi:hypothetical protein
MVTGDLLFVLKRVKCNNNEYLFLRLTKKTADCEVLTWICLVICFNPLGR